VLGPGQEAQPIREDTQLIPLPRPHIPITIKAIWALSDFTATTARRARCRPAWSRVLAGIRKDYDAVTVLLRRLLGLDAAAGKRGCRA
jgi:hypothetical protein